jgi:hypothetical protein
MECLNHSSFVLVEGQDEVTGLFYGTCTICKKPVTLMPTTPEVVDGPFSYEWK